MNPNKMNAYITIWSKKYFPEELKGMRNLVWLYVAIKTKKWSVKKPNQTFFCIN